MYYMWVIRRLHWELLWNGGDIARLFVFKVCDKSNMVKQFGTGLLKYGFGGFNFVILAFDSPDFHHRALIRFVPSFKQILTYAQLL
jgi:hypothetical protein